MIKLIWKKTFGNIKAKAYLDLQKRKDLGEKVDSSDIKKHKKDVLRIASELMLEKVEELPTAVAADIHDNLEEYLDGLEYAVEGTYLENLDEVTIRSDFRQLATGMYVSVLNRLYGCEYCYYSTNSEVYPYLHLYNKGKKERGKYGY